MQIVNEQQKSTPAEKQRVSAIMDEVDDVLSNLKWRWDNEKEHEDWNDYAKVIKAQVPSDCTFIKASKRPFGFQFKLNSNGLAYQISVTNTCIQWKRA